MTPSPGGHWRVPDAESPWPRHNDEMAGCAPNRHQLSVARENRWAFSRRIVRDQMGERGRPGAMGGSALGVALPISQANGRGIPFERFAVYEWITGQTASGR